MWKPWPVYHRAEVKLKHNRRTKPSLPISSHFWSCWTFVRRHPRSTTHHAGTQPPLKRKAESISLCPVCLTRAVCLVLNLVLGCQEGEVPAAYSQGGHRQTAAAASHCLQLSQPEQTDRCSCTSSTLTWRQQHSNKHFYLNKTHLLL